MRKNMEFDEKYLEKQAGVILNRLKIEPSSKILDIGTGRGMMTLSLAKKNYTVTSIDDNDKFQIEAKETSKKLGVDEKIHFLLGKLTELPFEDNSFDCVIAFQTLHHLKNKNKALLEMFRVVKKEGKVVIVEMNPVGMDIVSKIIHIPEHQHAVSDIKDMLEQFTKNVSIISMEIMDTYLAIK